MLDFFAGSGTTGEAAAKHGRNFLLVDENAAAVKIMETRLKPYGPTKEEWPVAEAIQP